MGMLNHAKVITTSNHKNKPCTKQFGNYKWISVIQIICIDGYALLPYVIMKKKCYFLFWYQNNDLFDTWYIQFNKTVKPPMKLAWIGLYILKHVQNFVQKMDINC